MGLRCTWCMWPLLAVLHGVVRCPHADMVRVSWVYILQINNACALLRQDIKRLKVACGAVRVHWNAPAAP